MAFASLLVGRGANKFGYKAVLIFGTIVGFAYLTLKGFVTIVFIIYVLNYPKVYMKYHLHHLLTPTLTHGERSSVMVVMFGLYWIVVTIITQTSRNLIHYFQNSFGISELMAYKYYTSLVAGIGLLGVFTILAIDEVKVGNNLNKLKKKIG